MMEWFDSVLGTIFFSIVVFILGGMIGRPLWCWVKKACPFLKNCDKP